MQKEETTIPEEEMMDDYFLWLCDKVGIDNGITSFYELGQELFYTEFKALLPMDENRALDGIALRDDFILDCEWFQDYPDMPCSVLEMLIALAQRMDFELTDLDSSGDNTAKYFWEMLDNLGLSHLSDDVYSLRNGEEKTILALSRLVARTYQYNGEGGLFPLKCPMEDQREVEIWYQMCAYLTENYTISS